MNEIIVSSDQTKKYIIEILNSKKKELLKEYKDNTDKNPEDILRELTVIDKHILNVNCNYKYYTMMDR